MVRKAAALAVLFMATVSTAYAQDAPKDGNAPRYVIERITSSKANEIWILDTYTGSVKVCTTEATGDISSDGVACTAWKK